MTTMLDEVPDLKQLHTFLAVVDQRGFGAAGRHLGISQPSISQQMRRLEDRLGHALFSRQGGSATLTSDGEALVIFARAMFSVADQVRTYFAQPGVEGSLRIGFNEDFARTALPSVLNIFVRSYPNLELLIDCNFSSRQLFAALDEGKLDLVVAKMAGGQVRGEHLWCERLRWVGRTGDIRFDDGPIPLVGASTPNVTRELVVKALADAGRTWRVRFQSPSLSAIEAAICAGLGVGAIMEGMEVGKGVVLDEACGLPPLGDVTLCLDTRADATEPAIAAFAAMLRAAVMQMNASRIKPPTASLVEPTTIT